LNRDGPFLVGYTFDLCKFIIKFLLVVGSILYNFKLENKNK